MVASAPLPDATDFIQQKNLKNECLKAPYWDENWLFSDLYPRLTYPNLLYHKDHKKRPP